MNRGRGIIGAVCIYYSDYSSKCFAANMDEATRNLAEIQKHLLLKDLKERAFSLVLAESDPSLTASILKEVEKRSAEAVAVLLHAQIAQLTPFQWQADDNRQVSNWAAQAERAAETGQNWSHQGTNIHKFRLPQLGSAYQQAQGLPGGGLNLHLQKWN